MVWVSGLLPYEQAAQVFERFGYGMVPPSSIWRRTQEYGEKLKAQVERRQDLVGVERVKLPLPGLDHAQRKGISMDGGMVNIRDEGWKEFKAGTVFDVEIRLERDEKTGDLVEKPHAINQAYTAVLGSVDQFAPAFWVVAVDHQVPLAADSVVTADGADWVWNLTADYFPDSIQIVDWYHACQHLHKSAVALFPDDSEQAQRWYTRCQDHLFLGNILPIISDLEHAGLERFSHYFHLHQRRMQYHLFLTDGYPIGSGTIESTIKQFKHRLSGPGMRWSRPAAERMLVIRSVVLSRSFDDLWAAAA